MRDYHQEMFEELTNDVSYRNFRQEILPKLSEYLKMTSRVILTSITDGLGQEGQHKIADAVKI